ncbi:hypothetical protein [Parapedobacter koreensis]|uniref:Uncharacterized protein n=1 Tax=Parapedobacter koreensis TaxID=332977 RepID=A0A1H7NLU0_9SPHI|nr:hypothetical protein [Parapedobacter koreensis]SEL24354.1 hypothetical protein SAMN05421740_10432 [Parapedobacter koreensis]
MKVSIYNGTKRKQLSDAKGVYDGKSYEIRTPLLHVKIDWSDDYENFIAGIRIIIENLDSNNYKFVPADGSGEFHYADQSITTECVKSEKIKFVPFILEKLANTPAETGATIRIRVHEVGGDMLSPEKLRLL